MDKCNHENCNHDHNHESMHQKYAELQTVDAQIKQIQQQLMGINQQILELKKVDDDLTEFEKVKTGSKMFFALGPGIFAEGSIDSKDLLLNVGSNITVKKPIMETKQLIDNQIKELESIVEKLQEDVQLVGLRGQELQQELVELDNCSKKSK
ncbi:MAG: prefoldin subunit alpha [Candidatus Nanoarchaeia archaeon]|nr:prefoldin subunit alpha [Candidatus Nanoarchaeia archaeon]